MKKIVKNLTSLFVGELASHVIGFFATIYLARLLAAEGFGLISYGIAFLSYALLFANPVLTTIGAREVAKTTEYHKTVEAIIGLRLFLAILVFFLFAIGTYFVPGEATTKKIVLLYCLSLFPFALLLEFVFQGKEEMGYIGFSRLLQYSAYIILLYILVRSGRDITMVPASLVLGYSVASIFLIVVYISKHRDLMPIFSLTAWHHLLKMSVPVGLATIFGQVALSLPPIILGIFHAKSDVGLFSAGFKIIATLLIIDRVFYYVFFPVMTKDFVQAPEKLAKNLGFVVKFLFSITIPVAFGGIIMAEKLVHLIYGVDYHGAIIVFQILLLYFLVAPVNTILGYGLISIDQERRYFKVITVTAVLNIILITLMGIYFKGTGAAVSLLISEAISTILMNREIHKSVKFTAAGHLLKPTMASLIMAVVLLFLVRLNTFLLIAVGICIYGTTLYLVGGFSREELKNIGQAFLQKS